LASSSAGQSNPSAGVFQVCPPPLLPNAVSFDSMRGSIRGFPWIDGLGVRGPVQSLRRRRPGLSNRGSGHGEQSIFQVLLPTAMVADSLIGTRHTRRCGRSSALTSPPPPVSSCSAAATPIRLPSAAATPVRLPSAAHYYPTITTSNVVTTSTVFLASWLSCRFQFTALRLCSGAWSFLLIVLLCSTGKIFYYFVLDPAHK
jgi:hypothetical protein